MNMNSVTSAMNSFDDKVGNWLSPVRDNEYVSAILILLLILYAGLAAPQLPEYIARLFENQFFILLFLFLIAYVARSRPSVAVIAALAVMISLYTLNKYNIRNMFIRAESFHRENMEAHLNRINDHEKMNKMMEEEHVQFNKPEYHQEENIPAESLSEMSEEHGAYASVQNAGCTKKANFRNSFYPQYMNLKPDSYMARYTGSDVGGYDPTARYAGDRLDDGYYTGRKSDSDAIRGTYNG